MVLHRARHTRGVSPVRTTRPDGCITAACAALHTGRVRWRWGRTWNRDAGYACRRLGQTCRWAAGSRGGCVIRVYLRLHPDPVEILHGAEAYPATFRQGTEGADFLSVQSETK